MAEKHETQEEFLDYHRANPEVYKLFDRFASKAARTGIPHYSPSEIFAVVKWEIQIEIRQGNNNFKFNKNFVTHYADLWMELHPEHENFFLKRKCK